MNRGPVISTENTFSNEYSEEFLPENSRINTEYK